MEMIQTSNGYKIRTTDASGRILYLSRIYGKRAQYTTDYTYAREYTRNGALRIIRILSEA